MKASASGLVQRRALRLLGFENPQQAHNEARGDPTRWPNQGYNINVFTSIRPQSIQMSTEQIERELLKLPASERARLAERLIASLDEEAEVDQAWLVEVRERDREIDPHAVETLPLKDALRTLRNRLSRG